MIRKILAFPLYVMEDLRDFIDKYEDEWIGFCLWILGLIMIGLIGLLIWWEV